MIIKCIVISGEIRAKAKYIVNFSIVKCKIRLSTIPYMLDELYGLFCSSILFADVLGDFPLSKPSLR